MLRVDLNYPQDFCDLYNKFNSTKKGKRFLEIFGISREKLDIVDMSRAYFSDNSGVDISIDKNSNIGKVKNANNYIGEILKAQLKLNSLYLLWNKTKDLTNLETANKVCEELLVGDLYMHDMMNVMTPYCFAFSTLNVMIDGKPKGQLLSKPPKRSDSFLAVTTEVAFELAQNLQGAVALPDLIINLAYYYNKENIDPKNKDHRYKIENDFQRFIHSVNQTYRSSNQSMFSNLSIFDRTLIKETFGDYKYPDGSSPLDIIEYIQDIQEIYMYVISKKDPQGKPLRFPVSTINIYSNKDNEIDDQKFLDLVCKYNKEGLFNIYITKDKAKLAMCCRFSNDSTYLRKYYKSDNFGNGGISIGSARVCTINLAKVGRLANKDKEKYFEILNEKLEDTRLLLKSQREILRKRIAGGFSVFHDLGWMHDSMFFSTFGILAVYESLEYMGYDIRTEEGITFTKEIFKFINEKLDIYSRDDGYSQNCEVIPGEGSASTLAEMDKIFFNDEEYKYEIYSNQFLPLWKSDDVVTRATIDGKICADITGGSICHLNISKAASEQQMRNLIEFAVKCGLQHFALNAVFCMCKNEHVIIGKIHKCPICGSEEIDAYTRVVGYYTPVKDWDKTRREVDFPNRKFNYL